jgi:peptide deformylase
MAILEIRKYPDRILKEKTEAVDEITPDIIKLIDDMVDTMV